MHTTKSLKCSYYCKWHQFTLPNQNKLNKPSSTSACCLYKELLSNIYYFFQSICTIFSTFSLITYTGKIHLSQRYFSFQANSSFLKPLKLYWNVFLPCPFSHIIIVHPSNTPTSLTTLSMKSCFLMPLRAQPCCIHNICSP